jgi:hypothetical protein
MLNHLLRTSKRQLFTAARSSRVRARVVGIVGIHDQSMDCTEYPSLVPHPSYTTMLYLYRLKMFQVCYGQTGF